MFKQTRLVLEIIFAEILAVLIGIGLREADRNYYFNTGLIPWAPFWFYDLAAPLTLTLLSGLAFGFAIYLHHYWDKRERPEYLEEADI